MRARLNHAHPPMKSKRPQPDGPASENRMLEYSIRMAFARNISYARDGVKKHLRPFFEDSDDIVLHPEVIDRSAIVGAELGHMRDFDKNLAAIPVNSHAKRRSFLRWAQKCADRLGQIDNDLRWTVARIEADSSPVTRAIHLTIFRVANSKEVSPKK